MTPGTRRLVGIGADAFLLGLILLAWELLVRFKGLPQLILPGPELVWRTLVGIVVDGTLWPHLWTTLAAVFGGFALGSLLGFGLGSLAALSPLAARLVRPYVVASQALPKLALAPLLAVWLGFDLAPKIVITALISFFPLFENTVLGLRSVDPAQRELFRSLRASDSQTFLRLLLPSALPSVVAGLRVALVLSLVGAVVAEFVGANRGLGALIVSAQGILNTPLMFAVFVVLTFVGVLLYGLSWGVEQLALRWRYGA